MDARTEPPFRAEHVGSLLRPRELVTARQKFRAGRIDTEALRAAEDDAIRDVVALQEDLGLRVATDGEFRRTSWHMDFIYQLGGVARTDEELVVQFRNDEGVGQFIADGLTVHKPVHLDAPIFTDDFRFLAGAVRTAMPKMTIPSPSMVLLRTGTAAVDRTVYPDLDEFWADLATAWADEIRALAEAVNEAIRDAPDDMTVAVHTCRGNFKSTWLASGSYDYVAETAFSTLDVDGFFLEFDDERSGGFEPLRYIPKGKKVVLGLVSSKTGSLESGDFLKRKIEEASKFVPLEDLCLSPQCGFSSTHHGNQLTQDEQWHKLERVVQTAKEVWR